MKYGPMFVLAAVGLATITATARTQPPGCYAPAPAYYAAPTTSYYVTPGPTSLPPTYSVYSVPAATMYAPATTTYYAAPGSPIAPPAYSIYFRPAYSDPYAVRNFVDQPPGMPYVTSSYTGYSSALFPPGYSSGYSTSAYGGARAPSTGSYLPGAAYYTPSQSYTPGYNRVFLTIGDFHY